MGGKQRLSALGEMVTFLCGLVTITATRIQYGDDQVSIAEKAKGFYESELKTRLESEHCDEFIAIEPVSKSFYLADTFIDAALAAKKAHPNRKSFVIRIGHDAAFHIGASES